MRPLHSRCRPPDLTALPRLALPATFHLLGERERKLGTMENIITKRLPTYPVRRSDGTLDCRPLCLIWEVTLRCNQACKFCGSRAGRARPDELSKEEAIDVVRQVAEMGTKEIALHGGEAYLRPDWLDIVRAATDLGMDCTMVTGGRGFTEQMAKDAKNAGMTAVSLSIDGVEATHDRLRGVAGSHASALSTLRHLRAAGVPVGCNTQLNRQNFAEIPELTELICSLPVYGWQVQLMVPMGRAADFEDLWLQPYDMLEIMPLLVEARRRCDARGIKLWPGDNVGYFGPFENALRAGRSMHGHCSGCGGGMIAIGIEAHGDVKGCSAMTSAGFVAGNVRKTPIREIWQSAPELGFIRNFKIDDLWGFCRTCYYAEECKGGCIWTASTVLGRRGNNPYCHHRAMEMLSRGKRERLRLVKAAEGLVRDKAEFDISEEDAPADWADEMRTKNVPEPAIVVAGRLAMSGELEQAEALLCEVLTADPKSVPALDQLGFVLYGRGRFAEAEQACRRSLELGSDNPYANKGLGLCVAKQGRVHEGIASVEKAIALAPKWFDPYWDLGVMLIDAGRFDDALQVIASGEAAVPSRSAEWARLRRTAVVRRDAAPAS
jgi:radical SAM protein with 4Fe4S-binding SPASM domain